MGYQRPSRGPEAGGSRQADGRSDERVGGTKPFTMPPGYLEYYGLRQPGIAAGSGAVVQAKDDPAAAPAAAAPADAAPGAASLIIADGAAAPSAGQMPRAEFLKRLHEAVMSTASDALGPLWSAAGCPYIESWFAQHQGVDAASLDRMARRYSGVAGPHGAQDYIAPICDRLRVGIGRWRAGEDVSSELAASGLAASADAAGQQQAQGAGIAPGAAVMRKEAPGQTHSASSPEQVAAELGPGSALDSTHAARMEGAFGESFSDVRIHTDGGAARQAEQQGALAFTVGNQVAFGAGQYSPGSPEGDALLAHELAHVVQQRGGSKGTGLGEAGEDVVQRKADVQSAGADHEADADQAAAGVMARLYGGARGVARAAAARVGVAMKSGLALQRCDSGKAKVRPAALGPPTPKPELHTERFGGDQALDDVLSGKSTIKPGEKSLQVTKVQEALVDLGVLGAGKVTGALDPDTVTALKAFQKKSGIPESGVVDAKTMVALKQGFDAFKPQRDIALDPATAKDPLAGTRALSADDRKAIDGTINPQVEVETVVDPHTGVKTVTIKDPVFQDDVGGKTFEQDLRAMLDAEITSQFNSMAKGKAADRADPKKMFDWKALEAVGAESKREVDTVFGGYKMGSEVKQGTVLNDRWEQQDTRIKDAKAAGDTATIEGITKWRIQKIMNEVQGFRDVLKKHGGKSDRAPEKDTIAKVQKELMKSREADLLELQKAWPGASGGGKIFLQRFKEGDAMADRLKLWGLFQTVIHEYLHSITAKEYSDYADALGPPRDQTLREGMTDLLTKTVWSNVSINDALRQKIEGPLYDAAKPVPIPPLSTYDATAQAEQLTSIVGVRNIYAAYFLGKVELIGKT